jgi:tetratricopeptide (TPR) repeat protein
MRGLAYFRKREYENAIADYTKAITLVDRAIALLDQQLQARLLASYRNLLASHYMVRGLAREKTGDSELAIADLRRSLEIVPDSPHLRGARDGLRRLGASP